MMSREEIRDALTGPIASIRTPFRRDGAIDFASLRNFLDFCMDAGSKTVLLTHGDSLYTILTDEEVVEVTRVVAEHAGGRAMVVAADRQWWTGKEVEFAKYARSVGADMLMVLPPDWAKSCTTQTFVDHYAAVSKHIPVMIVTNVFIARGTTFGIETLRRVMNEVDGVCAVKDDMRGEFARRLCLLTHERWAVFAGGQKQNHMSVLPYGCDGYLSTFITFKPQITHRYWQAIRSRDLDRAAEVIRDYDIPFFDFIMALPGGFNAGVHGTLELFGITKRWRRSPYYNLNGEEMERLADFFKNKGLL